jgi:hypothetical protein
MTVSDLKSLLEDLPGNQDITVTINRFDGDDDPILTYDIGFGKNEHSEFTLIVNGF